MTTILKIHSPKSGKITTRQTRGYTYESRLEGVEIEHSSMGTTQIKPPTGNYGSGEWDALNHHVLYKFPPSAAVGGHHRSGYPREFVQKYTMDLYRSTPDTALTCLTTRLSEWARLGGLDDSLHEHQTSVNEETGARVEIDRSDVLIPSKWIAYGHVDYTACIDVKAICEDADEMKSIHEEYQEVFTKVQEMYTSAQSARPEGHMVMKINLYEMFKTALEQGAVLPATYIDGDLFHDGSPSDDDDWADFESMLA